MAFSNLLAAQVVTVLKVGLARRKSEDHARPLRHCLNRFGLEFSR